MKFNTARNITESGGLSLKVPFKIAANKKSFGVLSGQIYSNIIPTIVRELSSNAFDSHREQDVVEPGRALIPFTVSCPADFDPYFSVADTGTGLRYFKYSANIINDACDDIEGAVASTVFIKGDIRDDIRNISMLILAGDTPDAVTVEVGGILYDKTNDETCLRLSGEFSGDDVSVEFDDTMVLYTTYFASTKEDTNDFIGGYGLGSKTPFAYTDNFMVTNRYNGTQRVYNIFVDDDGAPSLSLMDTSETTEHNGMEVRIGVKPEDFITFKEAIEDQLRFFIPQPTVLNDIVVMPKVLYEGEHFFIMDTPNRHASSGYYGKAGASVGFNAYEISRVDSKIFSTGKLALKFAIGEVMVIASREDLQYDYDTNRIIEQREKEALTEYREYVLDTLDTTNMVDWEKAAFLNNNSEILDLSDDRVKEMVGNSSYIYHRSSIRIPISGWGDYTLLRYTEQEEPDGTMSTVLIPNRCQFTRVLSWSEFNRNVGRTTKLGRDVSIEPNEPVVVFIRDNSFSFLKKIKYYLNQNLINRDTKILVMDMFSEDANQLDALEEVKHMIGHTASFVRLSGIKLPKDISLVPTSKCATPIARMFIPNKHMFGEPKYWSDIFTPLTKIERGAYIVKAHRGEMEGVSYDDINFVKHYIGAKMEWDDNDITVLMLSRARYEKALGYGFKPVKELIAKLKRDLVIPQNVVNARAVSELYHSISYSSLLNIMVKLSDEQMSRVNEASDVKVLLRVKNLIRSRYRGNKSDRYSVLDSLMGYMSEDELPKPTQFVERMVDLCHYLCDNLSQSLPLIASMNAYDFNSDAMKEALVEYLNFKQSKAEEQDA